MSNDLPPSIFSRRFCLQFTGEKITRFVMNSMENTIFLNSFQHFLCHTKKKSYYFNSNCDCNFICRTQAIYKEFYVTRDFEYNMSY